MQLLLYSVNCLVIQFLFYLVNCVVLHTYCSFFCIKCSSDEVMHCTCTTELNLCTCACCG
ncbi:hypothetical protein ZEAMMB73_Zm00001d036167 [Zea mays]|uniref:Uncharacterized protein n=1 Tax=Zea mays TaxID=4577 RepID=A0A1D6LL29_MAIZE|nr:hypothetical protein ZEAMMB73_Zm00001d036167 [Zea mays]AQK80395.1 hypothetical protein ZEAMMB73_Zm00001d036167 [Zea mays]